MAYLSPAELNLLKDELSARYDALLLTMEARVPKSATDGSGRGRWHDPEKVRILMSTVVQRKLAVDDFSAILRRIAALK
jgi:hypothetical protein